jgi:beta-glucosidase
MKVIKRADFGESFSWGVSTAAYQVEGAHDVDGKGLSIWDEFVSRRGKIYQGHHGNIACDFYNRFPDDLKLISQLNIPNHRFSLSWSRIIPEGTGRVSRKGIDFYNRLIDQSLALNIEPWVTLYHWDLPHSLHLEGGWTNRDVIGWFSNYVAVCAHHFGDRVKHWMVLNEPMVFTGAGYFLGVHAPGKKGIRNFLAAVHHATLAQAEGGRVMRQLQPHAKIGTTFSCSHIEPYRQTIKDYKAANQVDALLNRTFIEPLLGMGYPTDDLKILKRIEQFTRQDDEANMKFNMDFIGIQNYTRELVKYNPFNPFIAARIVKASERNVPLKTTMNWEVYPESIYHMLKKFAAYPEVKKLIVTENGAAFPDTFMDGKVEDKLRVNFMQDHIAEVLRAKQEGVNVQGYFIWTLLDNFEWAEGYLPTFGLIHINRSTLERTIKSSGYWYRDFLSH